MTKTRVLTVVAALAVALAVYALLGFFAAPALLKKRLMGHVEQQLGHKLALGEVRFNPFTFALEANDFNLQEADGGDLLRFKRLYVNFEAISIFRGAWDFAEVTLEAPRVYGELRTDGSNNFTALLARLSDPQAKPDSPPPPIKVALIRLSEGRIDLADLQAGKSARLAIAPVALELSALSTLRGEKGPYRLTARTADGETLTWDGTLSLYPINSSGKLVLTDWRLATFARMLGTRIAVQEATGRLHATLTYAAAYANGRPSFDVQDVDVRLAQFSVVPRGATTPVAAGEHLALRNATFALDARTLSAERAEWSRGTLAFEVDDEGRSNWASVYAGATPTAGDKSAPPAIDGSTKEAVPGQSAAIPPWRVKIQAVAVDDLAGRFADRRTGTAFDAPRAAIHAAIAAERAPSASTITLEEFKATIDGIGIDAAGDRVTADRLELASSAVKGTFGAGSGIDVRADAPVASIAGLVLRHAASELHARTLALRIGAVAATLPPAGNGSGRVEITDAKLETATVGARPTGLKKDAIELAALELGAKAIALSLGNASDASIDTLSGNLSGLNAREPARGTQLLRLERAQLSGGALNTRERRIDLDRMLLDNVHAAAAFDASGKLDWSTLIAAIAPPAATPAASTAPASPAWKAVVKRFDLQNLAASFNDHRQTPPVGLVVMNVNARARNLASDPTAHAQIALTGRIKEGGELAADGRINPHTLETDLKVKVADLSLLAVQPIVARHARLNVAHALGSAQGRLRYGLRKSAGADLLYEGDASLQKVAVEETEPRQPFLAIDALRGSGIRLAIGPDRLDISDLRVDGFDGKLFIAEDQSVNLTKVLRRDPATPAAAVQPSAGDAAKPGADDFPIAIARIRIDNSRLDFSDLSLRPQFAVRMHELKGVLTGVSSARESRAQVELEARVDDFGSGRIGGEINLFQPRAYTAIDMSFRNLEMTSLTPYTTKFAGYRIASGKLSMDLKYRIKDSALVGENKLVLDKLELGERVESPTALNLPLELAIAILKDGDGRIDIGLPVSGSLDDPQFSYGQLVWKALGNLFGRIVTAPFRAIASLFGGSGGSEKLEAIEFDAGRARLLPPEREKLRTLAEALSKRPQLKLTVKPAYAERLDRAALQSAAVRREIASRSGIKLAPDEDPGPVDYSNPDTQRAIETLFIDRNSPAAARDLRAQHKDIAAKSAGGAKAAGDAARAEAPAQLARAMAQQLFDSHPLPEAELTALAERRGEAIAQELSATGKIDPARFDTAKPAATAEAAERSVATMLELTIAK